MSKAQADGKTLADHHRQFAITKGLDPDDYLEQQYGCSMPQLLGALWELFNDLSATRRSGMAGPEALTYGEIAAYSQLYQQEFTPWEIDALRRLDYAWLKAIDDGNNSGAGTKGRKQGRK